MSEANESLGDYEKGDIIYLLLSKEQCARYWMTGWNVTTPAI